MTLLLVILYVDCVILILSNLGIYLGSDGLFLEINNATTDENFGESVQCFFCLI